MGRQAGRLSARLLAVLCIWYASSKRFVKTHAVRRTHILDLHLLIDGLRDARVVHDKEMALQSEAQADDTASFLILVQTSSTRFSVMVF